MFKVRLDDRLELRLLQPHHAPALFALTDLNRHHLRRWLPWLDHNKTVDDTARFIAQSLLSFAQTRAFVAGIWFEDQLAGVIGHNRIDASARISFPGYWLGEAFEGRGIMTRCCAALVENVFTELSLNKVLITVATGNLKSQAIPKRLGFSLEGTARDAEWLYDHYVDHLQFALLRRDWKPLASA